MALFLALAIGLSYLAARVFFQLFFGRKIDFTLSWRAVLTMLGLAFANLCVVLISLYIPDLELGNRFLHAVGGGVLAFLACFLAARDSGVAFTRFQFLALACLLVTMLGVGNELAEFFMQSVTHRIFAYSIEDTWLDLLSNTVGIAFSALALFPFLKKMRPASTVEA